MRIQCPKCGQAVPADQVNMATDLAFCPACEEAFNVSEAADQDAVDLEALRNPPKGAWLREEVNRVVIGATTRSGAACILIPFMLVWSGGSLGGIYGSQIAEGKFDVFVSLFGIPFLLGSIFLGVITLMALFGKVEVSIGRDSAIFTGVGRIGRTRRFDWLAVESIREELANGEDSSSSQGTIVMEGAERLEFGSGLSQERRYFLLNTLRYLKTET